ncbi:MAG: FkbM family methyltransferase [Chloroflexi bacterium]|nr:FkbM family methyltransferase [Chloroflexota bacterium]MBU1747970.1 FkbM family methyltransferase [Chloroflexota bacterium]
MVIDVGAGRGGDEIAVFSRAVGESGRVIAVEAHPVSFEFLEVFCRLNRLENTTRLQVAVMDRPGTMSMTESYAWFAATVDRNNQSPGIKVRATTLDEICEAQGIEAVAYLKMNIEGGERYALPGMEAMIQNVQTICVACHDFRANRGEGDHFRTRAFVEQWLAERGFELAWPPDHPFDFVRDYVFGLRRNTR